MSQHFGGIRPRVGEKGVSLIEVMFAMVILAFGVLGVMGMFQWADYGLRHGANGTRALAMVESRLEAKRTVPWGALLLDDLDSDGIPEIAMRDDGTEGDEEAGDGVYTASREQDGIRLVWTVQPDRAGSLHGAGSVVIQARASYQVGQGQWREIRIGTLRANPWYLGAR
ncbi:MAG TPA: choice-of-anchor X domain-containing protein [Nitrospiraceae bacterium]|nr:choice-of-anchor X domain-containing protein [Nitrospiraceae bacterium]